MLRFPSQRVVHRNFSLLAGWNALAGGQLMLNVVHPPLPTTPVSTLRNLAYVAFAMAAASLITRRRGGGSFAFDVAWGVSLALICVVVLVSASGQGQLMAGLYLLLLCLIAASQMRTGELRSALAAAVMVYVVCLRANPLLDSFGYGLFSSVVIVVTTLLVSHLVLSLRQQAMHDQLTGALNRRGLELLAANVHSQDARNATVSSCLAIDLDDFKPYNDAHGHAAGDARLAACVRDWRAALRATDLIARIGGDEFVVLLSGTPAAEAAPLLARMRDANDVAWTVGVSEWTYAEEFAEALKRADIALYQGKALRPPPYG